MYSTEGGWLQLSVDELCNDAVRRQCEGFHGAKIKVDPPLSGVCPNGARLEYIPQLGSITVSPSNVVIADGYAHPPTAPGMGLEWDREKIAHFASGTVAVQA